MIAGILQPSYLPWIGYFEQIHRSDVFVIYDDVQFEKGSWRNRNRIKTAAGAHWLTVPVLTKGRGYQLITDVELNNNGWQEKHIRTMEQYYGKAEFYGDYAPELAELLRRDWTLLVELNMALIAWFNAQLGITTPLVRSSELDIGGKNNARLVGILKHLGADTFFEGAAGRDYIDDTMFAEAGIKVEYQDYEHPVYTQLHGEFVSHLSIVDLLFNHGPDSLSILTNTR